MIPTVTKTKVARRRPKRKAIIVLGMHRAGTSAITRVLSLLGAQLPQNLMPATPANEKGYWESVDLWPIHEEMLCCAGTSWDGVLPFPETWCETGQAEDFQKKILSVLQRDFSSSGLYVIKDPRISRLVPLWLSVLRQFESVPHFVISVRHPLEVAASLEVRDGFLRAKSLLLWLRHLLEAEKATRRQRRSFVFYDALLQDWRATTEKISRDLKIRWPRKSHDVDVQIEEFLSRKQRHHQFAVADVKARADIVGWVKDAYSSALEAVAGNEQGVSDAFDRIRVDLETADIAFGPVIAAVRLQLSERDKQVETLRGGLTERDAQLNAVLHSTSWRMTAPLRFVVQQMKRVLKLMPKS